MCYIKTWACMRPAGAIVLLLVGACSVSATHFRYIYYSWEKTFGAAGQFSSPTGLAIGDLDSDGWADLFVADTGNNRIQRVNFNTATGQTEFETITGPGTAIGNVEGPSGLAFTKNIGLYVSETTGQRLFYVPLVPAGGGTVAGPPVALATGPGSAVGQVKAPLEVWASETCCDGKQDFRFVADTGNNRIQSFTHDPATGDTSFDVLMPAGTGIGEVMAPGGISFAARRGSVSASNGFVADTGNNRIQSVTFDPITGDPDFDLLMSPGTGLGEVMAPSAVVALKSRHGEYVGDVLDLIVADTGNNRIQFGTHDGTNVNWQIIGGGSLSMSSPSGLAVGDIDRDGRPDLIVADTGNNRLLFFKGVPEPSSVILAACAAVAIAYGRRNRHV